jgi:hypothetical protein
LALEEVVAATDPSRLWNPWSAPGLTALHTRLEAIRHRRRGSLDMASSAA